MDVCGVGSPREMDCVGWGLLVKWMYEMGSPNLICEREQVSSLQLVVLTLNPFGGEVRCLWNLGTQGSYSARQQ